MNRSRRRGDPKPDAGVAARSRLRAAGGRSPSAGTKGSTRIAGRAASQPATDSQRLFDEHVERLFACRACPTVAGTPVTGVVRDTKVMLVGQAPGPREEDARKPFAYTAGTRLFSWFAQIGIPEQEFRERVYIGAVIRCFPGRDLKAGGDRVPAPDEIARCSIHLDRELQLLKPNLVIAVGTLSAMQLVGKSQLKDVVGKTHRVERAGVTFDVIVLPHPSGRSTWTNKPENAELLGASLDLIRRALVIS